jgi:hypothetical protein
MAVAHVKSVAPGNTGAPTFAATTTNDLVTLFIIIAGTSMSASATITVTRSGWTLTNKFIADFGSGGNSGRVAVVSAYAPNTTSGSFTITSSDPTNTQFISALIDEWSGMRTSNPIGAKNTATPASGNPTVNLTPTSSTSMLAVGCSDTITAVGTIGGSTATKGCDDASQDWTEYLASVGTAQVACNFTGSGASIIAAWEILPPSVPDEDFVFIPGKMQIPDPTVLVFSPQDARREMVLAERRRKVCRAVAA